MKKVHLKRYILSLLMIFAVTLAFAGTEPPDPGGTPTGPPLGGGAPIGGGIAILLSLGATYGAKKLYDSRKENLEE